jgi:hypothetical protein
LLVLAGAASLYAFGFHGVGRTGSIFQHDLHHWYVSGRAWRAGLDPYKLENYLAVARTIPGIDYEWIKLGFSYPPHFAAFSLLISAPATLEGAIALMLLLQLASIAVVASCCVRMLEREKGGGADASARWVVPALVIGNPFTTHVVWTGQTALVAFACLLGCWQLRRRRGWEWLAGLLLAAATMKPQVGALPVLWIALERNWRVLLAAVAGGLLFMIVPLVQVGPATLVVEWLDALRVYTNGENPVSFYGHPNVFGFRSLLVAAKLPAPTLAPVAIGLVWVAWTARRYFSDLDVLAIVMTIASLFVYVHDYDLALLAPVFAALWAASRSSDARTVGVGVALALLFAPQRFLRGNVPEVLVHWREVVLLAAAVWLVATRLRGPSRTESVALA